MQNIIITNVGMCVYVVFLQTKWLAEINISKFIILFVSGLKIKNLTTTIIIIIISSVIIFNDLKKKFFFFF